MNKSNGYLAIILCSIALFLFGAHYLRYQQNIILEKDGYQMIKIDQSQTISPHDEPIVFIIEYNSSHKEIYKFNGYENDDFSSIDLMVFKLESNPKEDDFYFIEAFKNNLPYQKGLQNLEFEAMYDLVNSGDRFEARQLIQHNLEPGFFGYIDTMPLIFLFIGLFLFVVISIIDIIVLGFQKLLISDFTKYIIQLAFLLFLVFFMKIAPWQPTSTKAMLLRNVLVILPLYVSYQWLNLNYFKFFEFWKRQCFNFLLLFVGGNILMFIANRLAFLIDKNQFEKISHKPFFCTQESLAIGFLIAFTIGLMLNNLCKALLNHRKLNKPENMNSI